MIDQAWLKLLDVVRRELSAQDAFVQIGGAPPTEPSQVYVPLEGPRRLVAVLSEPPQHPEALRNKLLALRDAFLVSTSPRSADGPSPEVAASRSELDQALADLASRARAESAIVFDVDSPVVWGCSAVDAGGVDMNQLQETAEVDAAVCHAGLRWDALLENEVDATLQALADGLPHGSAGSATRVVERLHRLWVEHGARAVHRRLRIARSVRALGARSQRRGNPPGELTLREDAVNCVVREFATIYRLLLVFEQSFSPLHAEAAVQRGLGHIERLVLALPPVDPGGGRKKAARVLRLV